MVAPVNVTGNYFQIVGTAVPAGLTPRIRVRLSVASVTEDEAVSTVTKEFTPASNGSFTLPLIPTASMRAVKGSQAPETPYYVVMFDAADSAGNFRTSADTFHITVPPGGGSFMDLVDAPPTGGWVEVTNTGPDDPSSYGAGVIIVDTSGPLPFLSYTV